jgi:hypothetical protein
MGDVIGAHHRARLGDRHGRLWVEGHGQPCVVGRPCTIPGFDLSGDGDDEQPASTTPKMTMILRSIRHQGSKIRAPR